jgi:hypothetical protein
LSSVKNERIGPSTGSPRQHGMATGGNHKRWPAATRSLGIGFCVALHRVLQVYFDE